ncbi:MAG: transposase [Bacteroidaceae bacterium]|nr:transposase [Bacteroidaceae bacterium]
MGGREVAHLHLDEMDFEGEERGGLIPNGFYTEQIIQDFPIRDKKVVLHVRRRRWKTPEGKSVSRDWDLKAPGTRMTKEFAGRLKKIFGHVPDNCPFA